MTLQEEITALLHGDLVDESRVEELIHVLAVSPEKRGIFIDQIRLARAMTTLSVVSAPPRAADAKIFQGLAAIDAEFGAGVEPTRRDPVDAPRSGTPAPLFSRSAALLLGLLLFALGAGSTFLFRGDGSTPTTGSNERATNTTTAIGTPAIGTSAIGRDMPGAALTNGLTATHVAMIAVANASNADASNTAQVERLEGALSATGQRLRIAQRRIAVLERARAASAHAAALGRRTTVPATAPTADTTAPQTSTAIARSNRPTPIEPEGASATIDATVPQTTASAADQQRSASGHSSDDGASLAHSASLPPAASSRPLIADPREDNASTVGPWQIGVRDHYRLSLPRAYGLEKGHSIFFDRDLFLSYRIEGSPGGLVSALKLTLSGGETQFAQVFHTNNGGSPVDEIITQTPTVQYARVVVAPEVIRATHMTGAIEFGGGYAVNKATQVGPVMSLGLNTEYRPIDRIAVQLGVAAWTLWSQFGGQSIVSANINAHLGFAVGF